MVAHRVRLHFAGQAETCRKLGSDFTGRVLDLLAERLDESTTVGRKTLNWPGRLRDDALSLRLAGGLHRLVLTGEDAGLAAVYPGRGATPDNETLWRAIASALRTHDDVLTQFVESPPQTNEVARSGILLGGFLTVADQTGLPLRTLEIGASAGLNLHWDAWSYRLGDSHWGDPQSSVQLAPQWRGPLPPLCAVNVVSRAGCDQAPFDPADPAQALRLRAYIWADQTQRLQRIDAAIARAAASPVRVEKADAATWSGSKLETLTEGAATVLYHSIMWQYLPQATRSAIEATVAKAAGRASDTAPFAWLRMEPVPEGGACELRLAIWPGGTDRRLANVDFHGRWVEWLN